MKIIYVFIMVMVYSLPSFSKDVPDLIPYRKAEKWGYCNPDKKIIIDCVFEEARPFHEGNGIVRYNGQYLVINKQGVAISQPYNEIDDYNEGLTAYRSGELFGVLNSNGKVVIPPTYYYIGEFNNGCCWVMDKNRKYSVIDKHGNLITSLSFGFFIPFHNNRSIASTYSKNINEYVIISNRGKIIHLGGYDYLDSYNENLCLARKDSMYCYLNLAGKIQIPLSYKNACRFSEGLAIVVLHDDRFVAVNKKMKIKFEIPYTIGYENCEFRCKLLPVCNAEGKWGLINNKGVIVLSTIYDNISECSSGIVAVKQGEKWAFWRDGKFLTGFKYDENRVANYWTSQDYGYVFDGGLCRVLLGYIDVNGSEYWED